jgi:hypothetical protein
MRANDLLQERDLVLLRLIPTDGFTFLGLSAEMNISTSFIFTRVFSRTPFCCFCLRHAVHCSQELENGSNIICFVREWITMMYCHLYLHYRTKAG